MRLPFAATYAIRRTHSRRAGAFVVFAMLGALSFALLPAGCKSRAEHTSNPQLKQIDELINRQLPPGTPMSQVNFFLNSRGYPLEESHDPRTLIAIIEHVDTETLQPSAARVTFHFDANDKLVTYDLTAVTPTMVTHQ